MKLAVSSFLTLLVSTASAVIPPGADTPAFYLVTSSSSGDSNLLPLRTNGGEGGYATLGGSGPIGVFYFSQGALTAAPRPGSTATQRPLIGSILGSTGCTTYGSLGFTEGSSTNKCARYNIFAIQSNTENSQLGAKLTFNFVGRFYACGSNNDLWYKVDPSDGRQDCEALDLYTVPVQ